MGGLYKSSIMGGKDIYPRRLVDGMILCSMKASSSNPRKSLTSRIALLVLCVSMFFAHGATLGAQVLPVIRISVENTAAHVQTRSVQRFADELATRLEGRYDVRFFPAATLFRDSDVFRALTQGKLEIAVPGTWQFDRYVPEVGLFLLPSLYGRDASVTYGLMESQVGQQVVGLIERALDVKVLGRWIDLGHTHLFSKTRQIKRPSDVAGLRVRVAGGRGNELRIAAMGAMPISIAWTELPVALQRGSVDAVLTSYETVASARLWEHGISSVYEDRQYFAQYVPISSGLFWDSLDDDVRAIVLETWEGIVDQARRDALVAQAIARSQMVSNGVSITMAGSSQMAATRGELMRHEKEIVDAIGIPGELYRHYQTYMAGVDGSSR